LAGPTTVRADSYKIDPVHSTILFKINHFGVGNIYGRFDSFSGNVTFDQDDPSKDGADIQIKTDSVDTNALDRDKNVKGPDFFNAKQFQANDFTGVKKLTTQTTSLSSMVAGKFG
jgi:polyisoprenoid-binding protein YceI